MASGAEEGSADAPKEPPTRDRNWVAPEPPIPLGSLRQATADESEWAEARLRSLAAELDRSSQRARRLYAVTAALLRTLSPEHVSEVVVTEGAAAVGASGGVLITPVRGSMDVASAIDCPEEIVTWLRGRPLGGDDPFSLAFASGEPVWLGGLPFVFRPAAGTEAWAILPLPARDRVIGVLALRFEGRTAIPDEYRTFLVLLAQQCTQALERARLYEIERIARVKSQFAERQLAFLAAVSTRLATSLDEEQGLRSVAELIVTHVADLCTIHIADGLHGPRLGIAMTAANGEPMAVSPLESDAPLDFGEDIGYGRVLRTGSAEILAVTDDASLARMRLDPALIARLRAQGVTSQMSVPIVVRDDIVGAITVASRQPGRSFTSADLVLTEEVAARLGQTLDNARLFESMREASRAKSNFLAAMSHELRTPLNAILGYADLVLLDVGGELPPDTRSQIERIRAAARHLLRQVDDVLSFSRAESGRDALRVEPVRLEAVVGDAVGLIAPLASEKGIALTFMADPHAILHTDALRLGQILNNLLTNAVKFTLEGEIEVMAAVEDDRAIISVRDTGIGIAADDRDRIFDPFWQVEQAGTRRYGGAGIGLGVARHLARLLGGDIVLVSSPGEGSTFSLRIPSRLEATPPIEK
ncbi:MAG: GAF domain-containing sensor histidine kinase [Gemmatimonadetes bacterium]|nr:GAF domain-containing sensor histidine kinase [Gemmatimonadota bacterium]